MRLYLVRHGQSQANADSTCRVVDCELTELGWRQAALVAAELAPLGISQVLASPYRRTVDTAREIAAATGAPLALFPRAHEHHGIAPFGWTPPPLAEVRERYPDLPLPPSEAETGWHALPETVDAVAARMKEVLALLRASFASSQRVALVSHASPIQQMIGVVVGNTPQEATRLTVANCSLTVLDLDATPVGVEALARADFLQEKTPALV